MGGGLVKLKQKEVQITEILWILSHKNSTIMECILTFTSCVSTERPQRVSSDDQVVRDITALQDDSVKPAEERENWPLFSEWIWRQICN